MSVGKDYAFEGFRVLAVFVDPDEQKIIYGGTRTFLNLTENLIPLGIKVSTLETANTAISHLQRLSQVFEVDVTAKFTMTQQVLNAIRLGLKTRSDAIYCHSNSYEETLVPALFASILTRKPLFLAIMNMIPRSEDSLTMVDLVKLRVIKGGIRTSLRFLVFNASRRLACKLAEAVFTPSLATAEFVRTTFGAKRVEAVGLGIDEMWFSCSDVSKKFDAAYVGRIDKLKGLDTLIRAWKEVLKKNPKAKLAVVGGGNALNETVELASHLGVQDKVTFTGYVSDLASVRDILCSSRIFVFPSRTETFASVVAESMAVGLPCILSDIPALKEVYGRVALFANVDDYSDFAERILELLSDEERIARLGKSSRDYAKRFRWEEVTRKVASIMTESVQKAKVSETNFQKLFVQRV